MYLALGRGRPSFPPDFSCPVRTQVPIAGAACMSPTGLSPSVATLFQTSSATHLTRPVALQQHVRDRSYNPPCATPAGLTRTWFRLLPVRSPLLREYFLFLGVHEMFQFPRCPPHQWWVIVITTMGLPHSEIVGSKPARGSPTLIAASATSFIGTQRRGIHPLLILSSLQEDVAVVDRVLDRVRSRRIVPSRQTTTPHPTLCTW